MPPKGKGKKSKKQIEEEKRKYFPTIILKHSLLKRFLIKVSPKKSEGPKRSSNASWLKKRLSVRELLRLSAALRKKNAVKRKLSD